MIKQFSPEMMEKARSILRTLNMDQRRAVLWMQESGAPRPDSVNLGAPKLEQVNALARHRQGPLAVREAVAGRGFTLRLTELGQAVRRTLVSPVNRPPPA